MFLVVLGPEIINTVHECTSGLKFGLWVPPVLDLQLYVLTAPLSNRRMRNNVPNDVLVGLDQKVLVRIVVQRRSILLRGHVRLETHSAKETIRHPVARAGVLSQNEVKRWVKHDRKVF